jgi:amino acid transporter
MTTRPAVPRKAADRSGLGTFTGVFTPSILTILGIILFLRLGYVVGSAGFFRAMLIMLLANAISVLTSTSLAAIATNLKVKGGGDYYLISRTLGPEFGGAIGLVLFLAQSVSIAFYCIGFGEAVTSLHHFPSALSPTLVASAAVILLFFFAWLGTDWATKFQFMVMGVLAVALVSFFLGGITKWQPGVLLQNLHPPESGMGFWPLFAIFFPAVTGFTQGISMSGELKDPSGSLPLGTFLAVGVSIIVYLGVAFVFSGVLPNDLMVQRFDAMRQVARWGFMIDAGVIAATLSSAMASFLGAPRILQSLASDHIFRFLTPFSKVSGATGNPRRGVLLSGGIAILTVMIGKLNLIAPLVSMFFLISYGLLNYATYYEARTSSPSFRPKFRWFNCRFSLLGFLLCLGAMLAIDIRAGIIAVSILTAIYHFLKRSAGPSRWADSTRAYHLQKARENILSAAENPSHPKDWRPIILAFTNDVDRRPFLLGFAGWIEGGSGITTALRFIDGEGPVSRKQRASAEKELASSIRALNSHAFPLAINSPDILESIPVAIQAHGFGPLKANTLLVNWFGQLGTGIPGIGAVHYVEALLSAFRMGLNLVVFKSDEEQWRRIHDTAPENRRIDILWRNDATSRLMLLLGHLVRRDPFWEDSVLRVVGEKDGEDLGTCESSLRQSLDDMRIDAVATVVDHLDFDAMVATFASSSLVFLPCRISGHRLRSFTDTSLERLLPRLPATALVMAAEDIDLEAEPEKGVAADMAAAADALEEIEKRALKAEEEALSAREEANALIETLGSTENLLHLSPDEVSKIHSETVQAISRSEKFFRKAAKARARADNAAKAAEALGVSPDPKSNTADQ